MSSLVALRFIQVISLRQVQAHFLKLLSLFLLSMLLCVACHSSTSVTPQSNQPPLKVGYSLWPGYFPMVIAQEKGFFAEQGVNVEPVYSENYLEPISNFSAGQTDGVTLAMGSLMGIIGQNPDIQMVMLTDQSAGSDALVVQPEITGAKDLKGKRIGAKLGDFGELFVRQLMEAHNLTSDDFTLVNMEGESVPARLQSGDIQAGHTWDPYATQAVRTGAHTLFTSKETPGLIPSGIVFHSSVIRDRPQELKAFMKAWFQAQDYWLTHPQEGAALIAQALKLKTADVSTAGVQLMTLPKNLKALTPGTTTESLYYTAQLYADFFIRTGGLSTAPEVEKLIVPSFVQALSQEQP
ncbi:ABC transporter substrate-binding protein [Trichocoleus desertorum AS-A10]|uniref:ABC transporter substrate-binding protein n=1 Tax=Trichocoleus desertorum TaxID=1481672 RepID=UPI003297CF4C